MDKVIGDAPRTKKERERVSEKGSEQCSCGQEPPGRRGGAASAGSVYLVLVEVGLWGTVTYEVTEEHSASGLFAEAGEGARRHVWSTSSFHNPLLNHCPLASPSQSDCDKISSPHPLPRPVTGVSLPSAHLFLLLSLCSIAMLTNINMYQN